MLKFMNIFEDTTSDKGYVSIYDSVFKLMHKDTMVALIKMDQSIGKPISVIKVYNEELLPIVIKLEKDKSSENNTLTTSIRTWYNNRVIPVSRKDANRLLLSTKQNNLGTLALVNNSLSATDCYWLKHLSDSRRWNEVNYYANNFTDEFGDIMFRNIHSNTSSVMFSPDSTLTGIMTKRWMKHSNKLKLIKLDLEHKNRRVVNEVIATKLHEALGFDNYISYNNVNCKYNGITRLASACEAFTSETIEFIPIIEFIDKDIEDEKGIYNAIIEGVIKYTDITRDEIKSHLDYMFITDYLLSNDDRHLNNFGVIRTSNGYKTAPLFDTGNSLFYKLEYEELPKCSELKRLNSALFFEETEVFKDVDIYRIDSSMLSTFSEVIVELLSECTEDSWERINTIKDIFKYKLECLEYGEF